MEFADKPNFTVAGVTDWTAVGGHGSDSTLRTSEALARETLTLKPDGSGPAAEPAKEPSRIRKQAARSSGRRSREFCGKPSARAILSPGRQISRVDSAAAGRLPDRSSESWQRVRSGPGLPGKPAISPRRVSMSRNCWRMQDNAGLHRLLGELDEKMGDPLAAVHEDEQAVRLDPSEAELFRLGLGVIASPGRLASRGGFQEWNQGISQVGQNVGCAGHGSFCRRPLR